MSRHYKQLQQSNYSSHPMSQHHNNTVMTLLAEEKTESFECCNIGSAMSWHEPKLEHWRPEHPMSQHHTKTLAEDFKAIRFNVTTSEQKCRDIGLKDQTCRGNVATSEQNCKRKSINKLCRDINSVSQHRISNVTTLYQSSLDGEISPMSQHHNIIATLQQCRDISLR